MFFNDFLPREQVAKGANSDGNASTGEFGDGDSGAAAVFGFVAGAFDERVGREEFGEAAAKGAGAMAVDDTDARLARDGGFVEELVDAASGFLDGAADHVDFSRGAGRFAARARMDGDSAGALRLTS